MRNPLDRADSQALADVAVDQPRMIAVLPARIRRRWDAIALEQFAAAATTLAEENEELARRAYWAEQCADSWKREAEIAREGGTAGLTIDSRIVRLDQSVGATIDDDSEYRGSALVEFNKRFGEQS